MPSIIFRSLAMDTALTGIGSHAHLYSSLQRNSSSIPNLCVKVSGLLTNTGHSVAFRVSDVQPGVPINISGGPLSYKYRFHELHLHYGRTDDRGSEHTVSGTSFPGETCLETALSSVPMLLSLLRATQALNQELWCGMPFILKPDPLVVIRDTLTAYQYVDSILRTVLLPFLLQYPGLIFQQDSDKPQTTHFSMNCLASYQALLCPARSPDPSPIEHVLDMMGRRMPLLGNVDDLARQLEQIWQEIPQETIRRLYHSMSRRVSACIQARGG
ncbi:transposable element Tcb1 transposase [Trichonephila clavipes]|nr:transposable element Tcb1 transposase [Trichonephila clavipes]